MKKLFLALALALAPSLVSAQCSGVFPANTACSNVTGIPDVPTANPFNGGSIIVAGPPFGGRLTLISGVPVINVDVVSATQIFYAPDSGYTAPVNISGVMVPKQFASSITDQVGLTLTLNGSASWPANTLYDIFLYWTGSTPALATRAYDSAMLPTGPTLITPTTAISVGTTPTAWTRLSAAFDGTVSKPAATSARVVPSNTGTLSNCAGQDWGVGITKVLSQVVITAPTDDNLRGDGTTSLQVAIRGSNDLTNWQIIDVRNINTAGAMGQSFTIPINISNNIPYRYTEFCATGGGPANLNVAQIQFYFTSQPSTRRLAKYAGIPVNDATATVFVNGPTSISLGQYAGSYLGTMQTDSAGAVSAYVNFGPSRVYNLWNAQNQRTITLRAGIPCVTSAANCTYFLQSPTNIDWGPVQSSTAFSMTVLSGLANEPITATMQRGVYSNGAAATGASGGYESGLGIDTTNGFSGTEGDMVQDTTGVQIGLIVNSSVTLTPFFGSHIIYGVEKLSYLLTGGTIGLFADVRNTQIIASWRG